MYDRGRPRRSFAWPADAGHAARVLLIVVAALQAAAAGRLLWQATRAADGAGWWWAAAGIVLLGVSAAGWPAAWRAGRWRYAGIDTAGDSPAAPEAPAAPAAPEAPVSKVDSPVWVVLRGRVSVHARVTAWWRVANVLTVLRLSDPLGLAPRLLVVPASAAASLHRALHRHTPSRR